MANKKTCLTVTPEIRVLAKAVGISVPTALAKVGTWMDNNKTEEYPTIQQFSDYIQSSIVQFNALESQRQIDRVYDPKMRKDRATLIATLFSDELNRLQAENPNKTRVQLINEHTPLGIFTLVKNIFEDAYSEMEGYEAQEFKKIIDNFDALAEESAMDLILLEGLNVSLTQEAIEPNMNEDNPEGESFLDEAADDINKEEQILDGWQINWKFISANESLSQAVRAIIQRIPSRDFSGNQEVDDLGFIKYLDPNYVHSSLIDKLRFMTESSELIPLLEQLSLNKPWVKGVIELIKEDETLKSKFYQDFRKDFIPYWIQKRVLAIDGSYKYQTIAINRPEGINFLLNEWRDNYEGSNILTRRSIYNKNGTVNRENVLNNLRTAQRLQGSYNSLSDKGNIEEVEQWVNDNINFLTGLSRSIGIDINNETLKEALLVKELNIGIKVASPLETYLGELSTIFFELNKNKLGLNNGIEERVDFANEFKGPYQKIATIISKITENAIESSVFENGKSYYSHTVPSYLGKLIKNLKNVTNNKEKFDKFINEEYRQFLWFFKDGEFRNEWIKELVNNPKAKDVLDHKMLLNFNKSDYSDLDSLDYTLTLINEFFSDPSTNTAWYHIPILSDAPTGEFIKFNRYTNKNVPLKEDGTRQSYKEFILDKMIEVALQEYDRIKIVRARQEIIEKNPLLKIENFDDRGLDFQFIPSLNSIKEQIDNIDDSTVLRDLIKNNIAEAINQEFNSALNQWERWGLFTELNDGKLKFLDLKGGANKESASRILENYFWNSYFAESQILQLLTTDLAYYKNIEDFQKRNKQVHSPALRLNTESEYGRTTEKTLYIKDWEDFVSNSLKEIEEVLNRRVQEGLMSKIDRDNILYKYKNINVADAQAYRSLSSYRAILDMSGQWTPEMQASYDRFKNGTWNMIDFETLWQPKKPFMYTQVSKDSKTNIEGENINIKVPVQNKNSEFLLLPFGLIGNNPKLSALSEFMEDENIDLIQFESTVKVGKQGVIDINSINDKSQLKRLLREYANNPDLIHELPYSDYGIQQAVPEHSIDAIQLFGTQIRKLITADIADNITINVNGEPLTKKQWLDRYNAIITENIIESFREINDIFSDPKEVERILLEEVRNNKRYGPDMIKACTLDSSGKFNIPLFDPIQSQRVQSLLNSIIKSRITKQKIKGGSLVQVSNYGFTDELNIVWNKDAEGKATSIKHFECYMPWYTKQYFEQLIDKKTGQLDINKVPKNLLELIGYRIPTEDKYSMLPLVIKGFLPQQSGGGIMLPAEITTISGADFDIDKLYIMLPEFRVNKYYNREAFIEDLLIQNGQPINENSKANLRKLLEEGKTATEGNAYNIYQTWKASMDNYVDNSQTTISKVEYDSSKLPKDNSLQARNNMLIDMMKGILTNPDTASKLLNPGGFDTQKKSARIVTILQNTDKKVLTDWAKKKNMSIFNALNSLSLKELDNLANKSKKELNMLSPVTQVQLHQQNMTAAKLIGIFANHNANHALIQHTDVSLSQDGAFILNGKSLTSLHDIINNEGEFISRNNAGFLAASVDAVKDPVLNYINLNTFTADTAMLLSRLGYNPIEIGLLLSQPIVLEMTQEFNRESKNGLDKETIIDNVIDRYKENKNIGLKDYSNNEQFSIDMLVDSILNYKDIDGLDSNQIMNSSDYSVANYHNDQVKIGFLFRKIQASAQSLADLTAATRADTGGGGAGPTIADTEIKLQKVDDFLDDVLTNPLSRLVKANVIDNEISWSNENELRRKLLSSPLPFMQAFYTLGLKQTENLLSQYFPQYSPEFRGVVNRLRSITKTGKLNAKTINNIYNDLFTYILSDTQIFGGNDFYNTRNYYVNEFPSKFMEIVANNPEIANLSFIKGLKVIPKSEYNDVASIVFRNVGKLSTIQREEISRDWASMLYTNETSRTLAMDLFKYSFYRNGFAFGPNTFIHLAPTEIRLINPEYKNALDIILNQNKGLNENSRANYYSDFDLQYLLNHSDNRKLVPEIDDDSSINFLNENKDIIEEFTIKLPAKPRAADKSFYYRRTKEDTYWKPIIMKKLKGQEVLYYNQNYNSEYLDEAHYVKIDKLGVRNSFIEYEFGNNIDQITSVITKEEVNSTEVIESMRTVEVDYNSIPQYDDYSPIEESGRVAPNEEYSERNAEEEAALNAFNQIYGETSLPEDNPLDNFNSEEAKDNFKDEEGDPLC